MLLGFSDPFCIMFSGFSDPFCIVFLGFDDPFCIMFTSFTDPLCTTLSGFSDTFCIVITGFSDPFCIVSLNGKKVFTSSVKKKTLFPKWNELVTMEMKQEGSLLTIVSFGSTFNYQYTEC